MASWATRPNGSFSDPDAVNVLMSTCAVNPSARIYSSPQISGWLTGPPEQNSRWPNGSFGGLDAVNVFDEYMYMYCES